MTETEILEIEYQGKRIPYQMPLGIYLDGQITGRVHDSVMPKYTEISPEKLSELDKEGIKTVKEDATRQLEGIAKQDTEEVRQSLRNTINLTTLLLQQ